MIFGPLMMIIWLVIVIVIAVAVIRWLQAGTVGPLPSLMGRKRALEILEERFAKGEIDKDEFQEKAPAFGLTRLGGSGHTETTTEEIQQAVRRKYAEVAGSIAGRFRYLTGKEGAAALGYHLSVLSNLADEVSETFCGVGNPLALGPISTGEKALDIGCGAGTDMILASRLVGASGHVCGLDLTPEMVEKAQSNFVRARADKASAVVAGCEAIPYDNNAFDVVISNGALNLSPLKEQSLREIFRVLKPGGRLQFADIVLKEDLPDNLSNSLDAWSD